MARISGRGTTTCVSGGLANKRVNKGLGLTFGGETRGVIGREKLKDRTKRKIMEEKKREK